MQTRLGTVPLPSGVRAAKKGKTQVRLGLTEGAPADDTDHTHIYTSEKTSQTSPFQTHTLLNNVVALTPTT